MPVRVSARLKLALLAIAAALPGYASGQAPETGQPAATPPPAPPGQQQDAPDVLAFGDAQTRMTLPIRIGGSGPYPFLVDSGAERTVIAGELAARLDLAPGPTARLHSMTGTSKVATVIVPDLRLTRKRTADVNAPSLKGENIGAAGMIGLDMLKKQRIVLDFQKQTMTMSPSRFDAISRDPNVIVVTGRSRFGRLVLLNASMDGEKIMVVLDTGSQVTIGNEALRQRLIAKKRFRPGTPAELVSVTGDVLRAEYTSVKSLRLGGVWMKEVPMAFADAHPFKQLDLNDRPAILLGMDVLRLFKKVSVDFATREVRFLLPDLSLRDSVRMASAGAGSRRLR